MKTITYDDSAWKLIPAQPNEAMLNQISPISGKEERLPYWWYQALIKSAPTPPASEQQRAVVMPEGKLLVSAEPLRKVLFALLGAPHHIRELQATRTPTDLFADNPINVLIAELNAAQGGDA